VPLRQRSSSLLYAVLRFLRTTTVFAHLRVSSLLLRRRSVLWLSSSTCSSLQLPHLGASDDAVRFLVVPRLFSSRRSNGRRIPVLRARSGLIGDTLIIGSPVVLDFVSKLVTVVTVDSA